MIDLLLASVVLLVGVVQWATRNFADLGPRPHADALATAPDALGLLLVVLAAAAVLLRRSAPLAALALACGASVAALSLRYGVVVHLAPAVVLYEIARRDMRGLWWAGGALAAASLVAIAILEDRAFGSATDVVVDAVIWAGAAVAGTWQRRAAADAAARRRQEQRDAATQERMRIARELHDAAGHAITNIAAFAGAARVLRGHDPDRADAAVATVESLARRAVTEIDEIVTALRDDDDTGLGPPPGLARLDELVEHSAAAGLALEVARTGPARSLPGPTDRAAYRIVQEGLTNAARHGAGTASLRLHYGQTALEIEISNPIAVASLAPRSGGRGIVGMRERAGLLGGALSAGERGGRFELAATLPYDRHEHVG
jgi:signal transduction histidine kinase